MNTKKIMLLLVAMTLAQSSCATEQKGVRVKDVSELVGSDSRPVVISGYAKMVAGGIFLFSDVQAAQKEDWRRGVDVVSSSGADKAAKAAVGDGGCAEVRGAFVAFDENVVGIGNFRSSIGFIDATNVRLKRCN